MPSNVPPYPAGLATPMTPAPVLSTRQATPAPAAISRSVPPRPVAQVTTSRRTTDTVQAPVAPDPGAGVIPLVSSPEPGAMVIVRNDAPNAVTINLDGPASRTVTVGAGSTVPLNLAAGSYRITANSGSASSARSTLSVSSSGNYSLVVSSHPDGGRDVLSLIEPALGG
jgi:hypothetical protein